VHDAHIHEYAETHGDHDRARESERRTWAVVILTAGMMVAELAVGFWSGSLALLADGFHMATHAGALGLTALAYWFARTRAKDESFTFGTGKVYALSGYTSAIVLAIVAGWMIYESIERLVSPVAVKFGEALPIAVLGLVVNLVSAVLLGHGHVHADAGHGHGHGHGHDSDDGHAHGDHGHDHGPHDHGHKHHHHDHNLRAAYMHVLADALTSVLAIAALVAGRWFGITVLDPLMGLVGGAVILKWSWGLVRDAAKQLLDVTPSMNETRVIKEKLEAIDDVRVADLHLWEMGPGHRGCIVKLVTAAPRSTAYYRDLIKGCANVNHLTVEVQRCELGCDERKHSHAAT
jgi:cation diffusion facilitator family transporter